MTRYIQGDLIERRYQVESFIDAGGMQEVYQAEDTVLGRSVALKVPKNPSAQKRFRRSAVVAARVNHPNVAKTLDFFDSNGLEHLVEELVPGQNLRGLIEMYTTIDPFLAAHVAHHIAKGVAASHHAGVVHRDLKPNNILVSKEAWPRAIKISDFGIAKMAEEEIAKAIELGIEETITTSSTLKGALPYMAPEVIKEPKSATYPGDIWSVGAIIYEMVAGNRPFGQGYPAVAKILEGAMPSRPASRGNESQFGLLLEEIWGVLQRCFEKNPEERPTADQMVSLLSELCYSIQSREIGVVDSFGRKNMPYGFIAVAGQENVFFHRDCCYGGVPRVGQKVVFARHTGHGADRAFPVVPLANARQ